MQYILTEEEMKALKGNKEHVDIEKKTRELVHLFKSRVVEEIRRLIEPMDAYSWRNQEVARTVARVFKAADQTLDLQLKELSVVEPPTT